MSYQLKIESRAKKDLQSLDYVSQKRIAKKIKYFLSQKDPLQYAKILINPRLGEYRWRVGNYRIIFDVKGQTIFILRVQHRKDVYK